MRESRRDRRRRLREAYAYDFFCAYCGHGMRHFHETPSGEKVCCERACVERMRTAATPREMAGRV